MDQALGLMQKVVGPYERFDGFSGESINERSVNRHQLRERLPEVLSYDSLTLINYTPKCIDVSLL